MKGFKAQILFVLVFIAVLSAPAFATDFVWNNSASCTGVWSDANCWNGGASGTPNGATDNVYFNATYTGNSKIDTNTLVLNITMASTYTGTLTIDANLSLQYISTATTNTLNATAGRVITFNDTTQAGWTNFGNANFIGNATNPIKIQSNTTSPTTSWGMYQGNSRTATFTYVNISEANSGAGFQTDGKVTWNYVNYSTTTAALPYFNGADAGTSISNTIYTSTNANCNGFSYFYGTGASVTLTNVTYARCGLSLRDTNGFVGNGIYVYGVHSSNRIETYQSATTNTNISNYQYNGTSTFFWASRFASTSGTIDISNSNASGSLMALGTSTATCTQTIYMNNTTWSASLYDIAGANNRNWTSGFIESAKTNNTNQFFLLSSFREVNSSNLRYGFNQNDNVTLRNATLGINKSVIADNISIESGSNINIYNGNYLMINKNNVFSGNSNISFLSSNFISNTTALSNTSLLSDSNLVSYWKFDGNANDYKGINNATSINATSTSSGIFDNAYDYGGVLSSINIGDKSSLNITEAITISTWVYIRSQKDYAPIIMKGYSGVSSVTGGYVIRLHTDGKIHLRITNTTAVTDVYSPAVSFNTWHHIVGTYDKVNLTLYIDGVRIGANASTGSIKNSAYPLVFGNDSYNSTRIFDGIIDDTAIFNRSLSQSEITGLYFKNVSVITGGTLFVNRTNMTAVYQNLSSGKYINDSSLVSYYSLDNTLIDYKNRNNGTATGAIYTASGKFNGAYSFDGSGDYINITNSTDFNMTAFTLSAWVYPNDLTGTSSILAKAGADATNKYFHLYMDSAEAVYASTFNSAGTAVGDVRANPISIGSWHHLVYSFDGTYGYLYVDGQMVNTSIAFSGTRGGTTDTTAAIGGRYTTTWGTSFNGVIDDVSIYNRSLLPEEVLRIYDYNNNFNVSIMGSGITMYNMDGVPATPSGYINMSNYINISNSSTPGNSGNISLAYSQSEVSAYNITESSIRLWAYNGTWSQEVFGTQTLDTTNNIITAPFTNIYGYTTIAILGQSNAVTFVSQVPADINSTNVIGKLANFTYNIITAQNILNSTVNLFYKTNSTTSDGLIYVNGTLYSGFNNRTYNSTSSGNYVWNIFDNEIYPATYNILPGVLEQTPKMSYIMTTQTHGVLQTILNVSNITQYGWLEFNINNTTANTQPATIYYCNQSYTTGDFTTSPNCALFCTHTAAQGYDHTHGVYSGHIVCPMPINNTTGTLSGVKVTSQSQFIVRGATGAGAWNGNYISNITRTGWAKTTTNTGTAWTNLSGTFDMHVHQFNDSDTFYYYACANFTDGSQICDSVRNDPLQNGRLYPTAPSIYSPVSGIYNGTININYTASTGLYPIINYTIYLDNVMLGRIITIADNGLDLNYTWNSTDFTGLYIIEVRACDSLGQCTSGFSDQIAIINYNTGGGNISSANIFIIDKNKIYLLKKSDYIISGNNIFIIAKNVENVLYRILMMLVGGKF